MNYYEKKYGIKEDRTVAEFHKSRRMFCIVDDVLYIADPQLPYSHAVWFEKMGWMGKQDDDTFMENTVRGIVTAQGDVYFYVGYSFDVNDKAEKIFFNHLINLAKKLNLEPKAHVYGGLIRQTKPGQWPPKKEYGILSERYLDKF